MAGAGKARVFVLAIDDVTRSEQAARLVREHFSAPEHLRAGAQRHP